MKKALKLFLALLTVCITILALLPSSAEAAKNRNTSNIPIASLNLNNNAKKGAFNPKDASKKVVCDLKDTGDGVIAFLTNKNPVPVSVDAKLVYYNSDGKMLMATSDHNYCLEKGATCALFLNGPYDANYEDVEYSDYKISFTVDKSYGRKYAASKIKVSADMGADNVTAEIKNTSKYSLYSIQIAVVYFDSNNNAIGFDETYVDCQDTGSVDYITFNFPYDSNYYTVYPSSFKTYVNCAYN